MIYRLKALSVFFLFSALSIFSAAAVEPTWEVNLGSVFDNREGDTKMNDAKTFFFVTLAPEVGLKFTSSDRIAGGAVWTQPLENGVKNSKVVPTLYYRHESDAWKFSMGLFPRTQLREPLPGFIWCDSLSYFQRNIRGALVQYANRRGFFDAYIDWRGMQSVSTREAFNILFHGEWRPKSRTFLMGSHLLMNHLARRKNSPDDERVVDNFLVNPYVGLDFSHSAPLDSLIIKAGGVMTVERNRADDRGWRTPAGVWLDLVAEWRWLGLKNSFYSGGKLYPEYGLLSTTLYQGEPFYMSSFYNRTDIYAKILKNDYMTLQAQLNFNFAKDNFIFYQRLLLDINIGNLTAAHKK